MKNKRLCMGMAVLVLVLGMTVADNLDAQTDSRLNGTWTVTSDEGMEIEMTLHNGNFEQSSINRREGIQSFSRGTYTANNGVFTSRPTHFMNIGSMATLFGLESGKWYTLDEYRIAMRNYFTTLGLSQDVVNQMMENMTSFLPVNYSVVSSSLIMTATFDGKSGTVVFTKK